MRHVGIQTNNFRDLSPPLRTRAHKIQHTTTPSLHTTNLRALWFSHVTVSYTSVDCSSYPTVVVSKGPLPHTPPRPDPRLTTEICRRPASNICATARPRFCHRRPTAACWRRSTTVWVSSSSTAGPCRRRRWNRWIAAGGTQRSARNGYFLGESTQKKIKKRFKKMHPKIFLLPRQKVVSWRPFECVIIISARMI